ncbi:ABC transporter permease subunit [Klebsiella pneumoniae]|uniref:ABC transporter permease subunit n=1 Tax=Klebsiella pneumoniae TaxID=573 RepID=A0A927E005_KLEPN|nr:ABC transporter permease subunit [Klebsiella pneumoniae]
MVGLTLVQSAYTAEIIRGGFLGVDHGQYEAAAALGLPARRRTLRIILPQALRTILPSGFNEIISLAKGTAMVYVLGDAGTVLHHPDDLQPYPEVIPLLMVGAASVSGDHQRPLRHSVSGGTGPRRAASAARR